MYPSKNKFVSSWFLLGVLFLSGTCRQKTLESFEWQQYASPEEAGWSAEKLNDIRQEAEKIGSAAVMVVYRGRVLAAWGDVSRRFKCHSVRKSLFSALLGIYEDKGLIDLEKTIGDLGIDDIDPLSDEEKTATVGDLLTARSGIYHPAAKETSGMERNRPERGSHRPGEFFLYNNWDFNTLGVIFEQETGAKIFETFQKEIAGPLGMEDYRLKDQFYQFERSKSRHPAYAFRMSSRDLARFGWLYLKNGRWGDVPVVPSEWVEESTTPYSFARPGTGYGYMWWIYPEGGMADPERYPILNTYDKFAAIGTGGQLVLVIPGAEMVFVHRGDTDFTGGVGGPPIWLLAEKVLQAKTGDAAEHPKLEPLQAVPFSQPSPPLPERTEIRLPPEVLSRYEGTYEGEGGSRFIVRNLKTVLEGRLVGQGEADFFAESKTRFFAKAANVQLTFELNESGVPTHVVIDYAGRQMRAAKKE